MSKYEEILNIVTSRTLKRFWNNEYGKTVDNAHELIMLGEALEQAQKEHDELEELKRVPTAEEVCEAIQNHLTLANKIVYNGKNNSFELEYGNPTTYCIPLVEYKEGLVTQPFATPKILILIGRFYEGQANKNVLK